MKRKIPRYVQSPFHNQHPITLDGPLNLCIPRNPSNPRRAGGPPSAIAAEVSPFKNGRGMIRNIQIGLRHLRNTLREGRYGDDAWSPSDPSNVIHLAGF